ncbi:MAG TPA: hypothetical protein VG106_07095, partial [Vicinamibacterales bacterium]|nr:hypothetical protein [Vicinamibacterales bacterium]
PPKVDGRNMTMVLNPLKEAIVQKPPPPPKVRVARTAPEPTRPSEPQEEKPARPPKVTRAEGG